MSITVGQVAGIIAAAIFIVQHLFPNALIVVLVGLLRDKDTAVTWSVVQRQIGSTLWPTLLRSDTAASKGVNKKVKLISKLQYLGLALTALAAVVTPLGLHEAIVADDGFQSVPFKYLQDSGSMGSGTLPQGASITFLRECGNVGYVPCPGTNNDVSETVNGSQIIGNYDMSIPQVQQDLYQSGLEGMARTVSSFFDIRSRQYTLRSTPDLNNDQPYPVDTFRYLESLILDNKIEPIEGLVVDMQNGGVGFRNHTVPIGVGEGAEWTEDLLWLEPESQCVNTNLTLEFEIGNGGSLSSFAMQNVSLIDNGGFVDIIRKFPELSMNDNQVDPKLQDRAYRAAWMVNMLSALTMNVTRPSPDAFAYMNSKLGQKFPLSSSASVSSANGIVADYTFTTLVTPEDNTNHSVNSTNFLTNQTVTMTYGSYANPFNISISNYSDVGLLCSGVGDTDYANSSNILVSCGLFYSAAVRTDGVQTSIFAPYTTWQQNVYACASVNKVSIKEVSFNYNATLGNDLTSLTITNVQPKAYGNDSAMPLWGIEQPDPPMDIGGISQMWGLISDDNANAPNLSTKRAPELYLPGLSPSYSMPVGIPGYEYVPGSTSPAHVVGSLYSQNPNQVYGFDYTGATNLALFRRWQQLSESESTIPQIVRLIWTDIAANSMMGTRGWNSQGGLSSQKPKRDESTSSPEQNLVPVRVYRKRILYNWLYAIPAFLALAVFTVTGLAAIVMSLIHGGAARIRYYTDNLSAGRLLTSQQFGASQNMSRHDWYSSYGKLMVALKAVPSAATTSTPGHATLKQDQKPFLNASSTDLSSPEHPLQQLDTNRKPLQGHVRTQSHPKST